MAKKTIILVGGGIGASSALQVQLGLKSIFDMRLRGRQYLLDLPSEVQKIEPQFQVVFCPALSETPLVSEIRDALRDKCIEMAAFDRFVFYPASIYFSSVHETAEILVKLGLSTRDTGALIFDRHIISMSLSNFRSLDFSQPLAQGVSEVFEYFQKNHFDLSKPTGIFQASHVQTRERHFNAFEFDGQLLVKTSSKIEKLQGEYSFLKTAPDGTRVYFPQVGASKVSEGRFSYEIEYLPLFDLSRHFIHNSLDQEQIKKVLQALKTFLDRCPKKPVSNGEFREALTKWFITKLDERLIEFSQWSQYRQFCDIVEGSILRRPFMDFVSDLKQDLQNCIATSNGQFTIQSHGDLCFSNILWDKHLNVMKLIDPRGSLNSDDLFMPSFYDLSKISHSLCGGYDLITNCEVGTKIDHNMNIKLDYKNFESRLGRNKEIFKHFVSEAGFDYKLIRLGEASLFLSMLPLHIDRPSMLVEFFLASKTAFDDVGGLVNGGLRGKK